MRPSRRRATPRTCIDELIDRYGNPPKSVQGLVDVSLVRVTAARVGIAEIVQRGDQLILYSDIVGPKQLGEVMEKFPHRVLYQCTGPTLFQPARAEGRKPAGTAAGCGDPAAGRTESATDKAIKNKHLFAAVKSSKQVLCFWGKTLKFLWSFLYKERTEGAKCRAAVNGQSPSGGFARV